MNAKNIIKKSFVILLITLSAYTSTAQDRLFTYTYQSIVLNKGQKEVEIWNTYRFGKNDFYSRLDNRSEFELGLGNNLQTAFYLNLTTKTKTIENATNKFLETENEISFSNEWKYKLMDPVANPVGLALYGEFSIGSSEYELEGKIIIDKKINKFTVAANAIYEFETKPSYEIKNQVWEKEQKAGLNLAIAYPICKTFNLTMENTYNNVFVEGNLLHSALYSGFGFSYINSNYWINFTAMPQILSFKGGEKNGLNLDEYEKFQMRLLFSYSF